MHLRVLVVLLVLRLVLLLLILRHLGGVVLLLLVGGVGVVLQVLGDNHGTLVLLFLLLGKSIEFGPGLSAGRGECLGLGSLFLVPELVLLGVGGGDLGGVGIDLGLLGGGGDLVVDSLLLELESLPM